MSNKRQTKSAYMAARIPPMVKQAAESMAQSDGRSLASFLETLVREEAKRRGIPIIQPTAPQK